MRVEDYKWLFLDLNSYFASVEQQERPELRGRPVAIVPMETDYTMAIAASPEAKASGVKTGTGLTRSVRLTSFPAGFRRASAIARAWRPYHGD
jgi:DNA polymerase-4